ncbi:hypothetical protein RF11_07374 [Thelohanellus kitauei]|uniref:Integrase zinc-binding domain-containing protein n=1 Tax=Thelohanellus kitauei TaxID=669202 RepID=A0A0C2MG10_THEKT|nr:hypothetical protein RF11_07374 [Thelohanellus kitauei]
MATLIIDHGTNGSYITRNEAPNPKIVDLHAPSKNIFGHMKFQKFYGEFLASLLLFLCDRNTGKNFLIDTGAQLNNRLVDTRKNRMVHGHTLLTFERGYRSRFEYSFINLEEIRNKLKAILSEYPCTTSSTFNDNSPNMGSSTISLHQAPDRYSLPHLHDFTSQLVDCKIYSKVDLIRGYHQIMVREEDVGRQPPNFSAFYGLNGYRHRLHIHLPRRHSNLQPLRRRTRKPSSPAFLQIERIRLLVNVEKCVFGKGTKVEQIQKFHLPTSIKSLQTFTSRVNFYRRFIPNAAQIMPPFVKHHKRWLAFVGIPQLSSQSFQLIKQKKANIALLLYPQRDALLSLTKDVSETAKAFSSLLVFSVGNILQHRVNTTGNQNCVADALSHPSDNTIDCVSLRNRLFRHGTAATDRTRFLEKYNSYRLKIEKIPIGDTTTTVICDASLCKHRPIVSQTWRRRIFENIHSLSHPSTRSSIKIYSDRFDWPSLRKNVASWAKACISCQKAKVTRHVKAPITIFDVPSKRFAHIHVNIVGPLPMSKTFTHLHTIVDRFTR